MSRLQRLQQLWTDNEPRLLAQFYSGLWATLQTLEDPPEEAVQRIDRVLAAKPRTWAAAYQVERLLVPLYSPTELDAELRNRVVECDGTLSDNDVAYYTQRAGEVTSDEEKRALLSKILDDLQWLYTLKEQTRAYARLVRTRTSFVFVSSIIPFLVALGWARSGTSAAEFSYLSLALATGLWGASFSMLIGLRSRLEGIKLDQVKVIRRWSFLLSRAVIGVGAGLVLYLFLEAGLLAGPLFPDLGRSALEPEQLESILSEVVATRAGPDVLSEGPTREAIAQLAAAAGADPATGSEATDGADTQDALARNLAVLQRRLLASLDTVAAREVADQLNAAVTDPPRLPRGDLALLIVWALVAGFSESLVPNLLTRAEEQVELKPS